MFISRAQYRLAHSQIWLKTALKWHESGACEPCIPAVCLVTNNACRRAPKRLGDIIVESTNHVGDALLSMDEVVVGSRTPDGFIKDWHRRLAKS